MGSATPSAGRAGLSGKVLLCLHHRLDPDSGAPGATLALGSALQELGWAVEYFGFDDAFGATSRESVGEQVRFPWKVAAALARRAGQVDVVDASTGDAWLWGSLRTRRRRPAALITRAHGLEHAVDRAARQDGQPLSWKYPLYHGGLRLWEVRRSLRAADHCVMLNSLDQRYVRDRLDVPAERVSVLPNGIREHFLAAPDVAPADPGPLQLCFLGSWIQRKGTQILAGALEELEGAGLSYELTLLGTQLEEGVLESLPAQARPRVTLVPTFPNDELPELLARSEVLLFPSLAEGSSVALLEAMACGLAPVATRVGAAEDVVDPGRTGVLIEPGSASALSAAVLALADNRDRVMGLRRAAQEAGRGFGWDAVAQRTEELYERVIAERGA